MIYLLVSLIVLFGVAAFTFIGVNIGYCVIAKECMQKGKFEHSGQIYACYSIYSLGEDQLPDPLAEIEPFPIQIKHDSPFAPLTLSKIKFLSEDTRQDLEGGQSHHRKADRKRRFKRNRLVAKDYQPDRAKRLFNFPPHDYQYCCATCLSSAGYVQDRMILCPICGNKRCPKAQNHCFKCTQSNESDQTGELEALYAGLSISGDVLTERENKK